MLTNHTQYAITMLSEEVRPKTTTRPALTEAETWIIDTKHNRTERIIQLVNMPEGTHAQLFLAESIAAMNLLHLGHAKARGQFIMGMDTQPPTEDLCKQATEAAKSIRQNNGADNTGGWLFLGCFNPLQITEGRVFGICAR